MAFNGSSNNENQVVYEGQTVEILMELPFKLIILNQLAKELEISVFMLPQNRGYLD
jgi:hypothetical protein